MRKAAVYRLGLLPPDPAIAAFACGPLNRPGMFGVHATETLATFVAHADTAEAVPRLSSIAADRGRPENLRVVAVHDLARLGAADEVGRLTRDTGQRPDRAGLIAATFGIDADGRLFVADRRSEHVACAGGGPVLSAGELFLSLGGGRIQVVEVSNQSTGFCPEPESWPAVADALERLGIPHPGRFTPEVVFRRCEACGDRSVVKDGWFVCGVCGADLPAKWNF